MGRRFGPNAQLVNEPLIFDTSVWIDFLNKKETREAGFRHKVIIEMRNK